MTVEERAEYLRLSLASAGMAEDATKSALVLGFLCGYLLTANQEGIAIGDREWADAVDGAIASVQAAHP